MAKRCAFCGAVLGEKALFCKNCGTGVPSGTVCRKCSAALGEGAKFCRACGTAVFAALPVCARCGAEGKTGAKFCVVCGAPMETLADIVISAPPKAQVSISDEPPTSHSICPDCSAYVREGAAFCKKCGAALAEKPDSRQRRPVRRNFSAQRRVPQQRVKPAEKAPKEKSRRIFPRLVAAVLIVAFIITGIRHCNFFWRWDEPGYGEYIGGDVAKPVSGGVLGMSFMPEYTEAELAAAPIVRLPVSPEASFARDENVEVDFGDYNLLEQTELSISRLPGKSVSSLGLSVTAYDLSMGNGVNAFPLPITVTLPLTCGPDEVSDIRVFNEITGLWDAVPSVADHEAGTITFRTTHFCTVAELKMKMTDTILQELVDVMPLQNGYFTYAGNFENNGVLTPVTLPMSAFVRLIEDSADSGESIMHILEQGRVDPNDAYTSLMSESDIGVGTLENELSFFDWASTVPNPMLKQIIKSFQAVGVAILVARMSYQAYNGAAVGDILWNNAADITAAACTAYGIAYAYPPALVAATVIFALNSLYDVGEYAYNQTNEDYKLEMAYRTFCGTTDEYLSSQSCVVFNADTLELSVDSSNGRFEQESGSGTVKWVRLDPGGAGLTAAINVLYTRYAQQPQELNAAVTKLLDDYVKLFFRQNDEDVIKYLEDYSMLHDVTEMPSAEQIKDFEDRFRCHLYGKAAPIFREFAQKATDELMTKLYNDVVPGLLEQLNTVVSFQIVDDALGGDTFDNSAYADGTYTISFDYDDGRWANQRAKNYGQIKDKCVFAPQRDSNEVFRCNVYSLMQLNFPEAILITSIDSGRSAPIRLPFQLEAPVTAVLLKNESYDGVYTGESGADGLPAFYVGTANGHMYAAPAKNNGYFDIEMYRELTYNEANGNWEAQMTASDGEQFMYFLHFTPDDRDMYLSAQIIFADGTVVYYELKRTGPIEEMATPSPPEWTPPTDYQLNPVIPN